MKTRFRNPWFASAVLVCVIGLTMLVFAQARHTRRQSQDAAVQACAPNLEQLWAGFEIYAGSDRRQQYPLLSRELGHLMIRHEFSETAAIPFDKLFPDLNAFVCPSNSDGPRFDAENLDLDVIVDDHSYWYLGYMMLTDNHIRFFTELYAATAIQADPPFYLYLPEGNYVPVLDYPDTTQLVEAGAVAMVPLDAGVSAMNVVQWPLSIRGDEGDALIATARSRVPVLVERPNHHGKPGGHVLYLDGHVEFVEYPGKWPMTKQTIEGLTALDSLD